MRWMVAAVACVTALAGCSDGFDVAKARAEATAAPDALYAAMLEDGTLHGQELEVVTTGDGFHLVVGGVISYHAGDAVSIEMGFEEAVFNGEDGMEMLEDFRVRMLCTGERFVLLVDGGEDFGFEDVSVETPNTLGTCMPDPEADPEATMEEVVDVFGRLVASMGPQVGQMVEAMEDMFVIPEYELVAVRPGPGGAVVSTYDVTVGGMTMRVTATVEDGLIQEQEAVTEVDGFTSTATTTFLYGGERTAAPDWRGEEQV